MTTTTALDSALTKALGAFQHQSTRIVGAKHNLWICTVAMFTPRAHTVIYGAPGVAKSMLFDGLLSHLPEQRVFKTPAFKGSPPEQFLGPISIKRMAENDEYVRNVKGKFADSEYVFVDELLRTPRAVMPAFQTGMSDNLFDNGNGMERIPLRVFFGATNALVEAGDDDLGAFWDRFTFKLVQEPVRTQDGFIQILDGFLERRAHGGWMGNDVTPDELLLTRDEVDAVIEASTQIPFESDTKDALAQLSANLLAKGIIPSVRRTNHLAAALQTEALLRGRDKVTIEGLQLAKESLWTDIDEREAVHDAVLEFASQFEKDTAKLADEYDEMRAELIELQSNYAQTGAANVTSEMTNGALRLLRNHQVLRPRLETHISDAKGRDVGALTAIIDEMGAARTWVQEKLLGGLEV